MLYKNGLTLFDQKQSICGARVSWEHIHSPQGQEAVGVGGLPCKSTMFCPYYRDHGNILMRNMDMADGCLCWAGMSVAAYIPTLLHQKTSPICAGAGQALHATGVAYAA